MVDEEVENVLREIRERVRAEQQSHVQATREPLPVETTSPGDSRVELNAESAPLAAEARARIEAHLTTTARAWDRLPPVVSNRSGWLARLELWFKRRFKSATRWYVWEQVNFNAAVHHALGDTLEALAAYERQLAKLRAELRAESKARQAKLEGWQAEFEAQREAQKNDLMARLSAAEEQSIARDEQLRDAQSNIAAQLWDEASALADSLTHSLRREQQAQTAALQNEARERDEQLRDEARERDEQLRGEARVTFRQLSLEVGEAVVMQDRARRQLEARLDKLEGHESSDE